MARHQSAHASALSSSQWVSCAIRRRGVDECGLVAVAEVAERDRSGAHQRAVPGGATGALVLRARRRRARPLRWSTPPRPCRTRDVWTPTSRDVRDHVEPLADDAAEHGGVRPATHPGRAPAAGGSPSTCRRSTHRRRARSSRRRTPRGARRPATGPNSYWDPSASPAAEARTAPTARSSCAVERFIGVSSDQWSGVVAGQRAVRYASGTWCSPSRSSACPYFSASRSRVSSLSCLVRSGSVLWRMSESFTAFAAGCAAMRR